MRNSSSLSMPKGTTISRPRIPTVSHGTGSISRALAIVRKRANGGGIPSYAGGGAPHSGMAPYSGEPPIAGPVIGETGGREDALPVSVKAGSYVIPADVVAALGDGNTLAGMKQLERMMGGASGTAGAGAPARPYGALMASIGGAVAGNQGADETVPIMISDGEFVVTPEQVAQVGGGDLDQGHRALDAFIRQTRAAHVAKLRSLPGPAKG